MSKIFSIGVFGIILNPQGEILLCHRRDYDLWNLPGGSLEDGEAPWVGVAREVKEETGLVVSSSTLVGVYSKPEQHEIIFSFHCIVVPGVPIQTSESDKTTFFSFSSFPKNTSPRQVERVQDFLINPKNITLKEQRGKSSIELIKAGRL
ncbi:MAG: NUDIX domain-containing protein [Patescibacteria group bacterium]